ncbi:proteoglycan 4-like isoform X5 [Galleria mellonella]|uniref:Proteoglycan 4-like isoform X5 n=1 Tax=Galleria mellonella TaxID=7137 RepID=A0ABM3MVP4_GALME|nr:proteoglycan 4-like isoform X5 [Galleria mellonella]
MEPPKPKKTGNPHACEEGMDDLPKDYRSKEKRSAHVPPPPRRRRPRPPVVDPDVSSDSSASIEDSSPDNPPETEPEQPASAEEQSTTPEAQEEPNVVDEESVPELTERCPEPPPEEPEKLSPENLAKRRRASLLMLPEDTSALTLPLERTMRLLARDAAATPLLSMGGPSTSYQVDWSQPSTSQQAGSSRPSTSQQEDWARPSTSQQEDWARPSTSQQEDLARPSTSQQTEWLRPSTSLQTDSPRRSLSSSCDSAGVPGASRWSTSVCADDESMDSDIRLPSYPPSQESRSQSTATEIDEDPDTQPMEWSPLPEPSAGKRLSVTSDSSMPEILKGVEDTQQTERDEPAAAKLKHTEGVVKLTVCTPNLKDKKEDAPSAEETGSAATSVPAGSTASHPASGNQTPDPGLTAAGSSRPHSPRPAPSPVRSKEGELGDEKDRDDKQ